MTWEIHMPRNFAIRLGCPHGDGDSWVTVFDRNESFEEILQKTWEFKCREHGTQHGIPQEVMEVAPLDELRPAPKVSPSFDASHTAAPAQQRRSFRTSPRAPIRIPVTVHGFTKEGGNFREETETVIVNSNGALVILKARLSVGDALFLIHKSTRAQEEVRVAYVDLCSDQEFRVGLAFKQPVSNFWRSPRRKPRVPKNLRVLVRGTDHKGNAFKQTAYTVDLSQDGARLDGIGFLTAPGQTIEVRRLWRKADYRVIWVGQVGTKESNHVGLSAVQSRKNIWHMNLPDSFPPEDSKK